MCVSSCVLVCFECSLQEENVIFAGDEETLKTIKAYARDSIRNWHGYFTVAYFSLELIRVWTQICFVIG